MNTNPNPALIVRQTRKVKAIRAQWMRNLLLVGFSLAIGFATLLGGKVRWDEAPAMEVAMQMPGHVYSWGISIVLFSSLALVGAYQQYRNDMQDVERRHWLLIVGALLCSGWCFALGYCILDQMATDTTGITWNGPVTWIWFGLMWALKAAFDV